MNNINKTIAALFMAATFLPMSAQTTAKKECCKEKTECNKTECCKTGCEKMKQRMDYSSVHSHARPGRSQGQGEQPTYY